MRLRSVGNLLGAERYFDTIQEIANDISSEDDDISLETNSTTNSYEEDNLITNEKMAQYFDEIDT